MIIDEFRSSCFFLADSYFLSKLHLTCLSLYLVVPGSVTCCLDILQLTYPSSADNVALMLPSSVEKQHLRLYIADNLAVPGPVARHDDGHDVLLLAHLHV